MPRRLRFGVMSFGSTPEDWTGFARKAEELGFSTLIVSDHFGRQLAPLEALVAAAAHTTRLRLGTIVLDNDFRHPAALAKEAATIDVLSGGRFELGLGAGWLQADYQKTGLAFDPPAVRLERLAETVRICKAFFGPDEAVTFHGRHYHIDGLDAFPKPTQRPRPPIMIGGRQRRMLSLAAREADIVSISLLDRPAGSPAIPGDRRGAPAPAEPPPPSFAQKVDWVRQAAGARFPELELHVNVSLVEVASDQRAAVERVAARLGIPPAEVLRSPARLVGSVDAIAEQLLAWRERCGVSYFVVGARLMDAFAPVVAKLR
jgi:probable F420-dependent oxidoreductase